MSHTVDTILGTAALLLSFVATFGRPIVRAVRKRRALASRSRIADLTEGPCSVVGRVAAEGDPLIAPGSGEPCVAWSLDVAHRAADFSSPRAVHDERPFWVEDETGRVIVDPPETSAMQLLHLAAGDRLTPTARRVAQPALDAAGVGNFEDHLLSWSETSLRPGDVVLVQGHALLEVDRRGPIDPASRVPTRLVLRETDAARLLVTRLDERHASGGRS